MPHAAYRITPQRGKADCAIAAMACIFRRDFEEVLIAASQVAKTIWQSGLSAGEILRVARRLKVKAKWHTKFDAEEDIGVLWCSHNDTTKEHCVVLIEGWVIDPGHDPVSMWRYEEYCKAMNAFGNSLLQVTE
jgi:hypothetical protein